MKMEYKGRKQRINPLSHQKRHRSYTQLGNFNGGFSLCCQRCVGDSVATNQHTFFPILSSYSNTVSSSVFSRLVPINARNELEDKIEDLKHEIVHSAYSCMYAINTSLTCNICYSILQASETSIKLRTTQPVLRNSSSCFSPTLER